MKFGVRLENRGPWSDTKQAAVTAEKTGFDSIWLNDHLLPPIEPLDDPFREAWTALTALGAITNRVHLGTVVVCNSFRNPALLAKMASTLDSITNGRVILGIGAGWHRPEYEAYGFDFPSVRERMERLEESVKIIRTMLQEGSSSFNGKYYSARNAPSITVKGHKVPVWIGGGGPRLIRMAARHSDGWNAYRMSIDDYKKRRQACEKELKRSGRDQSELKLSMVTDAIVSSSRSRLEKLIVAADHQHGGTTARPYRILDSVVKGNREEAIKTAQQLRDSGIEHLILNFPPVDLSDQLEYFGEEVIPHFK